MTGGHTTEYDLTGFDAGRYAAETGRAAGADPGCRVFYEKLGLRT